eukprot:scaffold257909_cov27-Tisochrysis_lutea.AAC.2
MGSAQLILPCCEAVHRPQRAHQPPNARLILGHGRSLLAERRGGGHLLLWLVSIGGLVLRP